MTRVTYHWTETRPQTSRVTFFVRCVPETGAVKPWEVWGRNDVGREWHLTSHKSEASAAAKAAKTRDLFRARGELLPD